MPNPKRPDHWRMKTKLAAAMAKPNGNIAETSRRKKRKSQSYFHFGFSDVSLPVRTMYMLLTTQMVVSAYGVMTSTDGKKTR